MLQNKGYVMYQGFNISNCSCEMFTGLSVTSGRDIHDALYARGKKVGAEYRNSLNGAISALNRDGRVVISGNHVEEMCFPHLPFQAFISHSHQDERIALELAGFLKLWCGVDAFVDSCAWNYRDAIIKRLVEVVANRKPLTDREYLDLYVSVASHVDCMLNKALIGMIDECECLFFLNTPNSILSSRLGSATYSPWIYTELEASRVIRKKLSDARLQKVAESFTVDESPYGITYDIRLDHLASLQADDVIGWGVTAHRNGKSGFNALDVLYRTHPVDGGTK